MKPTKIVFFGSEEFSAPSLRALIDSEDFELEAVITKPDRARGRSSRLVAPLVKEIALEHEIPVLQPHNKQELISMTTELKSSLAVLVSYGMIIPQVVIDAFYDGIINVHPSKLPELRGPAPIEYTILEGLDSLWISIMKLDAGMDTGPVYAQTEHHLHEDIYRAELETLASEHGATELLKVLPAIADGSLSPTDQADLSGVESYSKMISKTDGLVHPEHDTALEIARKVRAYQGWPAAQLENPIFKIVKLHHASALEDPLDIEPPTPGVLFQHPSDRSLLLACADNTFLQIEALQPPGKPKMSGHDFINGYL